MRQYTTWFDRWNKKAMWFALILIGLSMSAGLVIHILTEPDGPLSYGQAAYLLTYPLIGLGIAFLVLVIFIRAAWRQFFHLSLIVVLVGCAGSGGGSSADADMPGTRTVCVEEESVDLLPHVERAIDAWNDGDTRPFCAETCTEHVHCLCKAVLHELGHALGIRTHPMTGMMATGSTRSPLGGLTFDDFVALPRNAPLLLLMDAEQPCTTEVQWGKPPGETHAYEVAWYNRGNKNIYIDPAKPWR